MMEYLSSAGKQYTAQQNKTMHFPFVTIKCLKISKISESWNSIFLFQDSSFLWHDVDDLKKALLEYSSLKHCYNLWQMSSISIHILSSTHGASCILVFHQSSLLHKYANITFQPTGWLREKRCTKWGKKTYLNIYWQNINDVGIFKRRIQWNGKWYVH